MKNPGILNIKTLSGDWCDKDIIMLHACFQLLTDCIEDEKLFTGHVDWNHDDEHKKAKEELEFLYNWWINRKNKDLEAELNDLEKEQYEEDNEMLIRLIKVRQYLWT